MSNTKSDFFYPERQLTPPSFYKGEIDCGYCENTRVRLYWWVDGDIKELQYHKRFVEGKCEHCDGGEV